MWRHLSANIMVIVVCNKLAAMFTYMYTMHGAR
jgi:hypothetical protein